MIAIYEAAAGVLSLVSFGTTLGSQPVFARRAVLLTALLLASLASVMAGVLLHRGSEQGRRLSLVVQALQIPRLTIPGLAYGLTLGADVALRLSGGLLGLEGGVYSRLTLALGSHGQPMYLGVNLLALMVFLYLMRAGCGSAAPRERSVDIRPPAV